MERMAFNSGDTIFRAGDDSDRAFLIVVGSVDAHLPNGRTRRIGPGEIFGEMGLIDRRPRSATMVTAEYTVCAAYSESELLDEIRSDPDEAIAFIRALISRLRDANEGR
jgi:CRP-like cAMP-binding protein